MCQIYNNRFALYEITDKGSSWIGPAMVAVVSNFASMRWAVFYVIILFILPMPILWWGVDLKKRMKQAGRYRMRKRNDPNLARISMTLSQLPSTSNDTANRLSISVENANAANKKHKKSEETDQETKNNTKANSRASVENKSLQKSLQRI